jgi:hypothetical protein
MTPSNLGMRWRSLAWIAAAAGMVSGCSVVLDSGRYHAVGDADSGTETDGEAFTSGDVAADVENCNVDLTTQCFPCAPTTSVQFLNACTSASCVPFDDTTRLTNLLPDGALPPLPSAGAGDGG